jgi:hypothetical protein
MHDGYKVCFAIVSITILEGIAMATGHNGTMLRLALIAVAGLGGFSVAQILRRKP